ncbi:MAG: hypothetical protein V4592_26120 [Bacteroidota bacterium]
MQTFYRAWLTVLLSCRCIFVIAQTKQSFKAFTAPIDSFRSRLPIEKLYLQTDRNDYAAGDTLWFKAYLFNSDLLRSGTRSGLLYVELDDSNNKMVKRQLVPLAQGLSWGCLAIDPKDTPDGIYTLRAYTNWMRNFGEDRIFTKTFYITAPNNNPRLVATNFKATQQQGKDNIQAILQFTGLNKQPVQLKDMQLKVMSGKHTLFNSKARTALDGQISLNFTLPDNIPVKNLIIISQDVVKGETVPGAMAIPIALNRPENTDLQFMPEGGNLVAGIPAHIAFKAIAEDGNGADLEGKIYSSNQTLIGTFKTLHAGMGAFDMTPQPGENYTAKITLPDGSVKTYPLPLVSLSGTGLKVMAKGPDSLELTLSATADLAGKGNSYYLAGQARGVVCYGAVITFTHQVVKITVANSIFPSGIAHFTLLNAGHQPLNERIIYVNHQDNLQISVVPGKAIYAPHDSIALQLQVSDKSGKPVSASLSLAVTDDNQVAIDSTASNIFNSLLLTGDLKGTVEHPGYYLDNDHPETLTALDNLMLTQGWVGYNWTEIYGPPLKPTYAAEPTFIVKGNVNNLFNKPMDGAQVTLLSKKPVLFSQAVTGKDGKFAFKGIIPVDTALFFIQARTKNGKDFGVDITVDEFAAPVFTSAIEHPAPWYVNSDTATLRNRQNREIKQIEDYNLTHKGTLLNTVVIADKKIVNGSENLNGPGEADQVLDETDLEKVPKKTIDELLLQYIKDFKFYGLWLPCDTCRVVPAYYMLKDKLINFIIDGVDMNFLFKQSRSVQTPWALDRMEFLKKYLSYLTAEEIKGIEIISSFQYASRYGLKYLGPTVPQDRYAFVEITTRDGKGPFMKKTPGNYLYRALPYTLPKTFYRPRYTAATKPNGADLRATIHWEPQIVTDSTGRANVSFYSADKPGKYTVIVQGADLNGAVGYRRSAIIIK